MTLDVQYLVCRFDLGDRVLEVVFGHGCQVESMPGSQMKRLLMNGSVEVRVATRQHSVAFAPRGRSLCPAPSNESTASYDISQPLALLIQPRLDRI
jgi:hypothetical protein